MATRLRVLCSFALPLLLSGCNRPVVTPDPPIPKSEPAKLEPGDAKATLTIVRTTSLMIGTFTITAACPLTFGTNEDDPGGPIMVYGSGTGAAVLASGAQGTGGSYDVKTEWPAEYEVIGWLVAGPGGCKVTLDVEEALLLSRVVILHAAGMEIPISGEDQFTAFPKLEFTEQFDPEPRTGDGGNSVFTLDDVCMPAYLGCDRWQPCPG
jgi:hypothetical protein